MGSSAPCVPSTPPFGRDAGNLKRDRAGLRAEVEGTHRADGLGKPPKRDLAFRGGFDDPWFVDVRAEGARRDLWTERSSAGTLYRFLILALFAALPALVFISLFVQSTRRGGDYAFDFRQFWQGAHDVVHGHSPYPSRQLLDTADDRITPVGIQHIFRFPYPAATAVLLVPFGALPFNIAAAIFVTLLGLAIPAALWIVGVRDFRIYGIVFGTVLAHGAIRLGTLTPILVLLVAVAWRWRDRRWICASALALGIVAKMFLWPMLVWLVATRRYATAAVSAALTVVSLLVGWAVIGFDGITLYPRLVGKLSDIVGVRGYSLYALGTRAGLSHGVSHALPYVVGLLVVAACVLVARRSAAGDRGAFAIAVLASIVLTPIVWLHYFTLLLVPLAIARPRLAWAWALPFLFWLTPTQENDGNAWSIIVGLVLALAIVIASAWPLPRGTGRLQEQTG